MFILPGRSAAGGRYARRRGPARPPPAPTAHGTGHSRPGRASRGGMPTVGGGRSAAAGRRRQVGGGRVGGGQGRRAAGSAAAGGGGGPRRQGRRRGGGSGGGGAGADPGPPLSRSTLSETLWPLVGAQWVLREESGRARAGAARAGRRWAGRARAGRGPGGARPAGLGAGGGWARVSAAGEGWRRAHPRWDAADRPRGSARRGSGRRGLRRWRRGSSPSSRRSPAWVPVRPARAVRSTTAERRRRGGGPPADALRTGGAHGFGRRRARATAPAAGHHPAGPSPTVEPRAGLRVTGAGGAVEVTSNARTWRRAPRPRPVHAGRHLRTAATTVILDGRVVVDRGRRRSSRRRRGRHRPRRRRHARWLRRHALRDEHDPAQGLRCGGRRGGAARLARRRAVRRRRGRPLVAPGDPARATPWSPGSPCGR